MQEEYLAGPEEFQLILNRLVSEILERTPEPCQLLLVGIQRRGADLARRIAARLQEACSQKIDLATLDINLYRDDWTRAPGRGPTPARSHMPCPVDDRHILLVDDVLFSGRTVRAALEALLDYGRPEKVELLVFVDRGHRELPIAADYTGRRIATARDAHVDVLVSELDGEDAIRVSY